MMDEVIKTLLLMSVKGSLIVALILSVKSMFGRFFNAKMHYYVWFAVIVSLTSPYAFIDAGDVSNMFSGDFIESTYESFDEIHMKNSNEWLGGISNRNIKVHPLESDLRVKAKSTGPFGLKSDFNFMRVAGWVWVFGVAVLCIIAALNIAAIKKHISKKKDVSDCDVIDIFKRCKDRLGIEKEIRLVETRKFSTPAVWGFCRPVVLLPVGMSKELGVEKLEFIFMHELSHVKRRDVLMNGVILAYQIVYWFNPLVFAGLSKMKNDIELVCDEMVLENIERDKHLAYGRSIVDVLEYLRKPCLIQPGMGFLKNRNELKRRIVMVKTYRGKLGRPSIVGGLIVLMIALVSAVGCENKNEIGASAVEALSNEEMELIFDEVSNHSVESFSVRKIAGAKDSVIGKDRESMESMIGKPYINTYYVNISDLESGDISSVAAYPIRGDEENDEIDSAFYVVFEGDKVVDCKIDGFNGIADDSLEDSDYRVKAYAYETGDIEERKLFNNGQEFDIEKFKKDFIGSSLSDFKDEFGRVHGFTEVVRKKDGIRLSVYPISLDYSSPTPALFIVSEDDLIKEVRIDGAWGALQFERLEEVFGE